MTARPTSHPLPAPRCRGARAALGGKPALPLRASGHGARDGVDRGAAGLGRGGDRRRHRPALALGPHRSSATRPFSGRVSTRRLLAAARSGSDTGLDAELWERLRGLVDRGIRRAACGSATRSSAMPPTRACRTAAGATSRPRREGDRGDGGLVGRGRGRRRSRSTSSRPSDRDKAWHYCRIAGDRARAIAAHVEAARFYERALTSARPLRDPRRPRACRRLGALGPCREAAGLFDGPRSTPCATRPTSLRDDPVEQSRVFALRTRARVRTGS